MAVATPTGGLASVTAKDVDRWLCEAWPRRQDYPNEIDCQTLATRINVIVDRGNASPQRRNSKAAIEMRRSKFMEAKKACPRIAQGIGARAGVSAVIGRHA